MRVTFPQLNAVTLHSGFVTLGSGSAPPLRRYFRLCSQLRAIELRFRRPGLSLFGRAKIFSSGDYGACSHCWLQGDYTVSEMEEWRKSQLACPADYKQTGHATIEWE